MENGNPQNVANTAWACATLGYEAPFLFDQLDRHLDRRLEKWNAQVLPIRATPLLSWALQRVQGFSREALGKERSSCSLWEQFADEDFWQLTQTRMFAKAEGVNLTQPPETMLTRMELALNIADNTGSNASEEISQLLQEIGFHHELEVSPDSTTSGGMMAIDMACKKRKIAVEYDGPSHYLKAVGSGVRTSTENGATKAKRRFLEQLGWNVINIDDREHDRVRRTPRRSSGCK